MLLGIVYGIVEEGLAVKSFFDPNWMDLDILGIYGRVWGVNVVWAVWLSIFHAVFSITVPIILVQILYPTLRDRTYLTTRKMATVSGIFIFTSVMIFLFLTPYRPPSIHYGLTFLLTGVVLWKARRGMTTPSLFAKVQERPF